MPQRLLTFAVLSLAAATGARDASALGFGRAQPSATLGAPLDFSVVVRLDNSEVLLPECVSAEVTVGDVQLPRASVGASLESGGGVPSIRVRTRPNIDEPVVAVMVTAGCESRISRRFTLFADPPGLAMGAPTAAELPLAAFVATAAPPGRELVAPMPVPTATDTAEGSVATLPATPVVATKQSAMVQTAIAQPRAPKAKPTPARVRARPAAAPVASGPRLRLDPTAPSAAAAALAAASAAEREAALMLAESAASAAQAQTALASARVAALEASMDALKRDALANREQMARLGQALADSESRGRWTPLLLAALLALLGVAGWLWVKLREARAERARAWWNGQAAAAEAATPSAAMDSQPVPTMPPRQIAQAIPAAVVMSVLPPVEAQVESTRPLPQAMLVPDPPTRDVSIEELLDLEQQAEFFIVLGQDDAAIDLLVGHLRSTGGTSPLPYLKLMDIYRRRGDEPSYERTRDRFNHRFNAVAPPWGSDASYGRPLEDYAEVMRQLQRNWPRTVDAMADLETLLFRTDGRELFDLPAYRDVLFLYSLARDLLEQGGRSAPRIDVLLPLSDGAGFTTTSARPYLSDDAPALHTTVDLVLDEPPTSPVDLDLSEPGVARPTSQFGFFEPAQPRPSPLG